MNVKLDVDRFVCHNFLSNSVAAMVRDITLCFSPEQGFISSGRHKVICLGKTKAER